MTNFFHKTGSLLAGIAMLLASFAAVAPLPTYAATNDIETPIALFTTSLSNGITSSQNTMTLKSGLTKDGTTLASSTYSFIIDEGNSNEEFVIADCTATACTNMQRGLSVITGTTTVSGLRYPHGRGSSVKITDAPLLLKTTRLLSGIAAFPNPLKYSSSVTTAIQALDSNTLASVGYANSLSFGAVPAASETAAGFVELATGGEAGSSTPSGSISRLALPTTIATSSYNAQTAGSVIPVTGAQSKTLDTRFTLGGAYVLPGQPIASSTILCTNASGSLYWCPVTSNSGLANLNFTPIAPAATVASTTVFQVNVPGGTLGTNNAIRMSMPVVYYSATGVGNEFFFEVGFGNASTTAKVISAAGTATGANVMRSLDIYIRNNGATNSQSVIQNVSTATTSFATAKTGTSSPMTVDTSVTQPLTLIVRSSDGSSALGVPMLLAEVLVRP